jgi:glycosyltransferase involved in cell wall biosynthesis
MKKEIRVKVIPDLSHVYLKSLYSEISKNEDIKIYEFKKSFADVKDFFKVDIFHFHWIEGLFIGYGRKNIFFYTFLFTALYLSLIFTIIFVLRKNLVITLHNVVTHRQLYPRLENKIFKLSLKLADGIIVHNNFSKKSAQQLYDVNPNKLFIVPMGNLNSSYLNEISKKKARKILNIPQEKFVILSFGYINKYKGIEELLEVFNYLLTHYKNMYLVIAGSCPDNNLKKKIEKFSAKFNDNVLIETEYVEDNKIQIFMNASDIGVLPYREITTSGSLLLYMAFKIPVIVTELESLKELMGSYGIYYKKDDLEDLKNEVIKASSGFYDLDSLGEKFFQISEQYNWDVIADKTIGIYKDMRI